MNVQTKEMNLELTFIVKYLNSKIYEFVYAFIS